MNAPVPAPGIAEALKPFASYDGTTYYGRPQLKAWQMEPPVVGAYILLAGLSGSAQILATVAAATGRPELDGAVRRGRYLSLLAPTLGAALLIYDLHTPKRFYNMLRVAKATSPMSIGTWILMGFSGCAFAAAAGQAGSDRWGRRWMHGAATAVGVPGAVLGAGLCTYTASLLASTSTPVWAAAASTLAVRFGSSSIATGAAALALGERDREARDRLDAVQAVALAAEAVLALTLKSHHRRAGVEGAYESASGQVEKYVATGLGVIAPLALLAASRLAKRPPPRGVSIAAGLLTLVGSAALRTSMLSLGNESARRPDVSFRFSTPQNLPKTWG